MCPLCLSTAALIGGGIGSTGALAAILVAAIRRPGNPSKQRKEDD
jgi:hypothetical protein